MSFGKYRAKYLKQSDAQPLLDSDDEEEVAATAPLSKRKIRLRADGSVKRLAPAPPRQPPPTVESMRKRPQVSVAPYKEQQYYLLDDRAPRMTRSAYGDRVQTEYKPFAWPFDRYNRSETVFDKTGRAISLRYYRDSSSSSSSSSSSDDDQATRRKNVFKNWEKFE